MEIICPKCGIKIEAKIKRKSRKNPQDNGEYTVPQELVGLESYAGDARLCAEWPKLLISWRRAFPAVDILAEVQRAHAWETSNPSRKKICRARFLFNWLSRQQDRRRVPASQDHILTPEMRHKAGVVDAMSRHVGKRVVDDSGQVWLVERIGLYRTGGIMLYGKMPLAQLEGFLKQCTGI